MDLSSVKSVSPNRKIFKKIAAVLFSLIIIFVSFTVITNANKAAQDVVEVVMVDYNGGLSAYMVLTEDHVKKYSIIKKEYTEDMLLYEDLSSVLNFYTKYYIRDGTVIYKDQLTDEKPQKNEWLYELDEKQEVLTLPYNYLEAGGDILMPGDRVRIRVTYEGTEEIAGSAQNGNPNGGYSSPSSRPVAKTEVLFDSIVIKDMLNSNSRSIYEVYKEVLKLSEDKRQDVMKSDEFLKNIQPRALLLEGSSEQINNFAKYKGNQGQSFLITILSRKSSNVIVDQLPTLEKEVESWIDKQRAK